MQKLGQEEPSLATDGVLTTSAPLPSSSDAAKDDDDDGFVPTVDVLSIDGMEPDFIDAEKEDDDIITARELV